MCLTKLVIFSKTQPTLGLQVFSGKIDDHCRLEIFISAVKYRYVGEITALEKKEAG